MAKQGYVVYTADKIKKRKQRMKKTKVIIGIIFLFLMLFFVVAHLRNQEVSFNGKYYLPAVQPFCG